MQDNVESLFNRKIFRDNGVYLLAADSELGNQKQTNAMFSYKWKAFSEVNLAEQERLFEFQKNWYLKLYGFETEDRFKRFLQDKRVVLDAGCGLGYKAKWFADLSPNTLVIGMDFSDAAFIAAKQYCSTENLVFAKGDIASTALKNSVVDYVSCDQVIHHTENPDKTCGELIRVLKKSGELAVYVYAKKALPRELLDEHFRSMTKSLSVDQLMEMSKQLTVLGKNLVDLDAKIDVPDIPALGIKGGRMDVQRFIYWNLIKCFWNEELGEDTSISTNFDWYSPSNAYRYSVEEFEKMVMQYDVKSVFIRSEEACHTGRFLKY